MRRERYWTQRKERQFSLHYSTRLLLARCSSLTHNATWSRQTDWLAREGRKLKENEGTESSKKGLRVTRKRRRSKQERKDSRKRREEDCKWKMWERASFPFLPSSLTRSWLVAPIPSPSRREVWIPHRPPLQPLLPHSLVPTFIINLHPSLSLPMIWRSLSTLWVPKWRTLMRYESSSSPLSLSLSL